MKRRITGLPSRFGGCSAPTANVTAVTLGSDCPRFGGVLRRQWEKPPTGPCWLDPSGQGWSVPQGQFATANSMMRFHKPDDLTVIIGRSPKKRRPRFGSHMRTVPVRVFGSALKTIPQNGDDRPYSGERQIFCDQLAIPQIRTDNPHYGERKASLNLGCPVFGGATEGARTAVRSA